LNNLQVQGFCKFLSKILTLYIRQKAHKSFSYLVFLFVQQPLFRDTGFTTVEFYENPDKKWISVNGKR
ncbi:MAG: hypothetical protein WAW77_06435, partial [Caldibacillus thermoamylovorans]